jgi:hypothetical protein
MGQRINEILGLSSSSQRSKKNLNFASIWLFLRFCFLPLLQRVRGCFDGIKNNCQESFCSHSSNFSNWGIWSSTLLLLYDHSSKTVMNSSPFLLASLVDLAGRDIAQIRWY